MLSKLTIEQVVDSQKERLTKIDPGLPRWFAGLTEAMDFFGANHGHIITLNQTDTFRFENKTIIAQPFYEWVKPLWKTETQT